MYFIGRAKVFSRVSKEFRPRPNCKFISTELLLSQKPLPEVKNHVEFSNFNNDCTSETYVGQHDFLSVSRLKQCGKNFQCCVQCVNCPKHVILNAEGKKSSSKSKDNRENVCTVAVELYVLEAHQNIK